MLDQWPLPSNSGARVHDKLMLKCLTEDWNAVVLCWDDYESEKSIDLPPALVLPHCRLGWRNILPAVLGLYLRGRPLHHTEFLSHDSQRRLAEIVGNVRPDVIVLSSPDLASTVPFLKKICDAKIVVDTHDIQLQRCQSILRTLQITNVGQLLRYWLMIRSYTLIEKHFYRDVDSAWVLKEEDRKTLLSYHSCKNIEIVPNVVDPDSVGVLLENNLTISEDAAAFVYVGKYDYEPNEHCAMMLMDWFAEGPIATSQVPLYLIGVAPSSAMERKASAISNVHITGPVPSLQEYLKPIDRIFIAPILAGGGVKRKVIEAMAMGCPVLTTQVGAEGLELRSGETAEICAIEDFPQRALDLINDREHRQKLATAGQRHILARFGYERVRASVRTAIEKISG